MKEQMPRQNLTIKSQNPHTRGGEIFMEGKADDQKPINPPRTTENTSQGKTSQPQEADPIIAMQREVKAARWIKNYLKEQGREALTFEENQTIDVLKKTGHFPPHPIAGGVGEPPPTEPPERNPFRGITDPSLEPLLRDVRDFIDSIDPRAGVNRERYEDLYRQIVVAIPPRGYTLQQREEWRQQRQSFLNGLAESLKARFIEQRGELPETAEKKTKLILAIEKQDYNEIDRIIEAENPNTSSPVYTSLIEAVAERFGSEAHRDKSYMVDYLLEYAVERILRRADVSPKDAYPQPGFYEGINLDSVIATARIYDTSIGRQEKIGMFKYLSSLRFRRQIMHELFRAMKNRQDYATYITQHLRKEGLAFVEKEIAGVSDVQILYEKVLGSRLSFKKGWLTSQDMQQAEEDVETLLNEYNSKDAIKKELKNAAGEVIRDAQGRILSRSLRPWEVSRALRVGTSLNAATQRRIVYTILGDIPFGDIDTLLDSVDSEFLARILAPMKLITHRFLGIDTNLRKIFIEELLKKTKELAIASGQNFGYEKIDENGKKTVQGLYGKEEDSWAILDTGITDPKSNGWRGRMIFLMQQDYATEVLAGERLSIGDYMNRVKSEIRGGVEKMLKEKYPRKKQREIDSIIETQYGGQIEKDFNKEIKVSLEKQRLFLGAILQMKGGDLNLESKQMIWEKVAELLPSRIAAFFPEETLEIVRKAYNLPEGASRQVLLGHWNALKTKIFLAESMRVKDDAEYLKGKTWREIGDGVLKNLSDYYRDARIGEPSMGLGEQDPEIRIIKEFTSLGKEKAAELAKIKFLYTPFLDDVPKTDWENIDDASYDRILVQDQSDFQEGYNAIIGLMAKPVQQPEKVVEAFVKANEKIQGPLGEKRGSQAVIEKYISAYLSVARMNGLAKWFSAVMKLGRIPRSKMEEGNLQAKIAMVEEEQSKILEGLAQHDVISDDPLEVDSKGLTQYMRMKRENDADLKAKAYMWARMIIFIFGTTFGIELIKAFLPPDIVKLFQ